MPSVLIELGFISNHAEEDFLNSEKGQVYMASAIYRAFKAYKIKLEGVDSSIKPEVKDVKTNKQESPKEQVVEPVKETVTENVPDPASAPIGGLNISKETNPEAADNAVNSDLDYRVQVATSTKKLELKSYNFKGHGDVSMSESHGKYKYYLGHFANFDDALAYQRELRAKDFEDAFLVVFYKDEEISLKKAENLSNQNK